MLRNLELFTAVTLLTLAEPASLMTYKDKYR